MNKKIKVLKEPLKHFLANLIAFELVAIATIYFLVKDAPILIYTILCSFIFLVAVLILLIFLLQTSDVRKIKSAIEDKIGECKFMFVEEGLDSSHHHTGELLVITNENKLYRVKIVKAEIEEIEELEELTKVI